MAEALLTFTSHIAGKNAKVRIYSDRIEWERPRGISAAKLTAGVFTAGASLLATGVKNGNSGTEMIPVKSISSVTTKRDGLLNTLVQVITSGNIIDFRVSHSEAENVRALLNKLILEPIAMPTSAVSAPSGSDVAQQLQQLDLLRQQGILTQAEFDTKKAEMLGRL